MNLSYTRNKSWLPLLGDARHLRCVATEDRRAAQPADRTSFDKISVCEPEGPKRHLLLRHHRDVAYSYDRNMTRKAKISCEESYGEHLVAKTDVKGGDALRRREDLKRNRTDVVVCNT